MKQSETERDAGVLSNPLSFLHSGDLFWDNAGLGNRGSRGYYWSLRSANTTLSYGLGFISAGLYPQTNSGHGDGFVARCELHSSFLELLERFSQSFSERSLIRVA